jgi:hypothetical protein
MSHMADRDHIAITSGDKSTTTCKVSVLGCPVAQWIAVTQGDSSDTYSRIAPDSEIVPGVCPQRPARRHPGRHPRPQLTCSNSLNARHLACTLAYIARATSLWPQAIPSITAPSSATDSSRLRASSLSRLTRPP